MIFVENLQNSGFSRRFFFSFHWKSSALHFFPWIPKEKMCFFPTNLSVFHRFFRRIVLTFFFRSRSFFFRFSMVFWSILSQVLTNFWSSRWGRFWSTFWPAFDRFLRPFWGGFWTRFWLGFGATFGEVLGRFLADFWAGFWPVSGRLFRSISEDPEKCRKSKGGILGKEIC